MEKNLFIMVVLIASASLQDTDTIVLEHFERPRHHWHVLHDSILGGHSSGTFQIDHHVGVLEGTVNNLNADSHPGFIRALTKLDVFPDISSCSALQLEVKSNADFAGLFFSFGTSTPNDKTKPWVYGYKAALDVPWDGHWHEIRLNLAEFLDDWDPDTGKALVSCEKDADTCPSRQALQNLQTMALWGEGVLGDVLLEIQSISAIGCAGRSAAS